MKSIAAFANTNDGTIFIGIDDEGKITGIAGSTPGEKATLRHRIFSSVRERIKPIPPISVDFEPVRDFVVGKIRVARGDEHFYFIDGAIYVRYGDSDIRADAGLVDQILDQFAWGSG